MLRTMSPLRCGEMLLDGNGAARANKPNFQLANTYGKLDFVSLIECNPRFSDGLMFTC